MPYEQPAALLSGVKSGHRDAKAEIDRRFRAPLTYLVSFETQNLKTTCLNSDLLIKRLLLYVELVLKSETVDSWQARPWEEMSAFVLLKANHTLWVLSQKQPDAPPTVSHHSGEPRSRALGYQVDVFSKPCDYIGGDWAEATFQEKALWAAVGDVSGKSWPAYILKCALPDLWHIGLAEFPKTSRDLLLFLHNQLSTCLPDGLFVDMILGRFPENGPADIGFGGAGSGLYIRRRSGQFEKIRMGGIYLGMHHADALPVDSRWDIAAVTLQPGDALSMGSDGVCDQFPQDDVLAKLTTKPAGAASASSLHEAMIHLLTSQLRQAPQVDDMTVLSVLRSQ